MDKNTMANGNKIRSMDMGDTNGKMGLYMKVIIGKINGMAMALCMRLKRVERISRKEFCMKEYGKREREANMLENEYLLIYQRF